MKLYEYQVKEIFAKYEINIQKGELAKTPQEAKEIAAAIGGSVVLKSQILAGGRGKAGGVKIVDELSGGATPEKVIRAVKVVIQDKDVKGILFHLKKPPSLKVVMAKWFYHKNSYIC